MIYELCIPISVHVELYVDLDRGERPGPAQFHRATRRVGLVPCLVEWDDEVPEWDVLEAESLRAASVQREAL